jgi:hypothetical protein
MGEFVGIKMETVPVLSLQQRLLFSHVHSHGVDYTCWSLSVFCGALQAHDPLAETASGGHYIGARLPADLAPKIDALNLHIYSFYNNETGSRIGVHPEHPGSSMNGEQKRYIHKYVLTGMRTMLCALGLCTLERVVTCFPDILSSAHPGGKGPHSAIRALMHHKVSGANPQHAADRHLDGIMQRRV